MTKYASYPAYKETGVEWIGKVPAHWEVKKIAHMTPVKRGASPRPIDDPRYFDDAGEFGWVRIQDVTACGGRLTSTRQQLSPLGASKSVKMQPGQLFLSIAATVGVPCFTGMKCCIHDGFVYFPNLQISPQWLYRIFESKECFVGLGKMGTQLNLNTETVGNIIAPVPPLEEQASINEALDRETARIDALIEKKTRFIELLKEKRQALITQAVTKGLDPTVPMKDSGVEWIGEVPAHWDVLPVKRLVSIPITDGPHETPTKQNEGIPFVSAEAIRTGHIDFDKIWGYISEADHARYSKKYKPKVGDIYMVKSGATTGVTAMVEDPREFNIWSPLAAMRPNNLVEPNYLLAALRSTSFLDGVAINWSYGTQQNIGMKTLSDLPVALPSREEQRCILSGIAREGERVAKLLNATERSIDLLKERRSALITAAVTGQIDLREDAA